MELNLTQSLVMGLFSGLTEPMAVSPEAHSGLLRYMLGLKDIHPFFTLACHVAVFIALMTTGRLELPRLHRSWKQLRLPPKRRTHQPELNSANTLKLLRSAAVLVIGGTLLGTYLRDASDHIIILVLTLSIGGFLLWLPNLHATANKDARNLEQRDGMIMGLAAAAGNVPGLSPVGVCMAAASIRGVDRRYALRFAWILLLVRLLTLIFIDIVSVIGVGLELGWIEVLCCVIGAASSAFGAWLSVRAMRRLVDSGSITGFCYYNWGMALLCLTLYLTVY